MHIPDNYLSPSTCAALGVVMVPVWARATAVVKKELSKKRLPLMGIGAAFSFLVMMFNIPLPGGTTGHAVGGTLVAILLGPAAASISITIALLIQALVFGDGGVLAFGANSFNMAFLLPYTGFFLYKFIKDRAKSEWVENAGVFIASYIAINIAVLFTSIEFGIQPLLFKDASGLPLYCPYPLSVSVPAMMIPHLIVGGVVEGIITVGVYKFIKKVSPGIVFEETKIKVNPVYGLLFAMILLSPLGLLATGTAWGEWSAEEIHSVALSGKSLGFIPKGMMKGFSFSSIMPDYTVNGIPEVIGYFLSAAFGAGILLIVFKLLFNRNNN